MEKDQIPALFKWLMLNCFRLLSEWELCFINTAHSAAPQGSYACGLSLSAKKHIVHNVKPTLDTVELNGERDRRTKALRPNDANRLKKNIKNQPQDFNLAVNTHFQGMLEQLLDSDESLTL